MIIGTGVDILEVKRMESLLKRKPWPEKLFTEAEISPCKEEGFAFKRIVFRMAGIFAAKESVMKALGKGWGQGTAWNEIVITHSEAGAPQVTLYGKTKAIADSLGVKKIFLSISHSNDNAIAFTVMEGSDSNN